MSTARAHTTILVRGARLDSSLASPVITERLNTRECAWLNSIFEIVHNIFVGVSVVVGYGSVRALSVYCMRARRFFRSLIAVTATADVIVAV